jgi:hypothetical protein
MSVSAHDYGPDRTRFKQPMLLLWGEFGDNMVTMFNDIAAQVDLYIYTCWVPRLGSDHAA